MRLIAFFILGLVLITTVSAQIEIIRTSNNKVINLQSPTPAINYSLINVNNSDFLDGFDSSYFYPYSNPSNFINSTFNSTYATWLPNYTLYSPNWYNHTLAVNTLWGQWFYNQTTPAITDINSRFWNRTQSYNSTEIDTNLSLRYLATNPNNFVNLTGWLPNNATENNNYNTTGNITANYGFFSYLGSSISRITKGWFTDINVSGNVTADYFIGNGSQLTSIAYTETDPVFTASNSSLVHIGGTETITGLKNFNGGLRIKSASTGYNILASASTATNVTNSLPAITGTLATTANTAQTFAGTITLSSATAPAFTVDSGGVRIGGASTFEDYIDLNQKTPQIIFTDTDAGHNDYTFDTAASIITLRDTTTSIDYLTITSATNITNTRLLQLTSITLPTCSSTYAGTMGRNATGIYGCNSSCWGAGGTCGNRIF